MHRSLPRRSAARPVADAPVDALVSRSEELAKGWLVALLEDLPLAQAPSIISPELAHVGPRLCEAVVRALADDSEIGRISRGDALELPMPRTLPGAGAATTGEGAVQAVDALQAVVWSAVREELRRPDAEQVALLAERLSLVFERLRAAAVHAVGPPPGEPIVAELWRRTLEEEVMRAERTGAALAVLLVELEDADRILAVDAPSEASATLARFPQAVRSAVRTGDVVARESDGRVWVAARETGAVQARGLAARISDAVRGAEPWRGAPLCATVGVAALGEHGRSAEELILSAEEARFAAAAAGLPSND